MLNRRELIQVASVAAFSAAAPLMLRGQPGTPPKKLVFVHGRGQAGFDPLKLKSAWMTALTRGAALNHQKIAGDIDVRFPFYGDTLEALTQQLGTPVTSDIHSRGGPSDDDYLLFQAQFYEEVRQKTGVSDAQINAEYGGDPEARGPLNWKWVQAILRAIDKSGSGMNRQSLELFTRDVFLYVTRQGVRQQIDQIVSAQLTEEPAIVVAHSLGTVVAYNILNTDPRALRVPLFVTVGCPLAVRAVRDRFRPIKSPRPVAKWYNAFDTRDVVALYPLDKANFDVTPAIENNATVKNHTDNRHGIDGYLDDAVVAKHVVGALGG